MQKAGVGVIGLGVGKSHLRAYDECERAEVVAICDADHDRLQGVAAERPGVRTFTDYRAMLQMEELQGVSVALPNHLHAPVSIEAMRAGRHVLCEKPMALNVAQAQEMKSVAEREGRILMMRFNARLGPTAQAARKLADAGMLGDVYHVATTFTRRDVYPGLGGWFGQKDKSGGGPLIDLGVHSLDVAMWILGYPRPVSVCGQTYDWMARRKLEGKDVAFDCEDFAVTLIRLETGATIYLVASWDAHQKARIEKTLRVYGTQGGIFDDGEAVLCRAEQGTYTVTTLDGLPAGKSMVGEFCDCILDGKEPSATAEQGVVCQKILDATYASAESGQEVKID